MHKKYYVFDFKGEDELPSPKFRGASASDHARKQKKGGLASSDADVAPTPKRKRKRASSATVSAPTRKNARSVAGGSALANAGSLSNSGCASSVAGGVAPSVAHVLAPTVGMVSPSTTGGHVGSPSVAVHVSGPIVDMVSPSTTVGHGVSFSAGVAGVHVSAPIVDMVSLSTTVGHGVSFSAGVAGVHLSASPASLRAHSTSASIGERHPQLPIPNQASRVDCEFLSPFMQWKLWEENKEDIDRFKGGQVDDDMIYAFLHDHVEPFMREVSVTYRMQGGGELNCRPLVAALWPLIGSVAKRHNNNEEEQFFGSTENENIDVVLSKVQSLSQDSFDEFYAQHEQSLSSMDAADQRGYVDFCIYVSWMREILCKAVVDCKGFKLEGGWFLPERMDIPQTVCQVFVYAHYHAIANARHGRVGDIHLIGMNSKAYGLAVLECYGVIDVQDGQISEEAFRKFKVQEEEFTKRMKSKGDHLYHEVVSLQSLNAKLELVKSKLETRGLAFIDRSYPVGTVYVLENTRDWDNFNPETVPNPYENCMLLEFLLRTLVGERVCKMSKSEMERTIQRNKESSGLFREHAYSLVKGTWKYGELMAKRKRRARG